MKAVHAKTARSLQRKTDNEKSSRKPKRLSRKALQIVHSEEKIGSLPSAMAAMSGLIGVEAVIVALSATVITLSPLTVYIALVVSVTAFLAMMAFLRPLFISPSK